MAAAWNLHSEGAHVVGFLPAQCAAALRRTCRHNQQELADACIAICRPAAACRFAANAARALQRELRSRPCLEPIKSRLLSNVAERIEQDLPICDAAEASGRARLYRTDNDMAMAPIDACDLPDFIAAASLASLLESPHATPYVRSIACVGLGQLGPAVQPHVGTLEEQLKHESAEVRILAVEALGFLGPTAVPVATSVAAMLRDCCPHVCARAGEALRRLGGRAPSAVAQSVGNLLKDQSRYVRARAVFVLGRMGAGAAGQVEAVAALLVDEHRDVQAVAHQALSNIIGAEVPAAMALLGPARAIAQQPVPANDGPESPTRFPFSRLKASSRCKAVLPGSVFSVKARSIQDRKFPPPSAMHLPELAAKRAKVTFSTPGLHR